MEELRPTSLKLRFRDANIGHRIFKAMSLKALAIFKPSAILNAVVIALYTFFWFSLIASLLTQTLVDST